MKVIKIILGVTLISLLDPMATADRAIPRGYNRVLFYDDFSSGSLDRSSWKVNTGTSYPGGPANWGTGEIQTYADSPANVFVRDGDLFIMAQRNDKGEWTSARIETVAEHDFSCPAGGKLLIEGNIKLGAAGTDTQAGIWPAFWLLGSAYRGNYQNWPSVGEIDILESPNGESRTWNTVHCGDTWQGGPCNESQGIGSTFPLSRGEWNLIALQIDRSASPQTITWSINSNPSFVLTADDVGDDKAWKSLIESPKMMLLNIAVGGAFPNALAQRATPNDKTEDGEGSQMQVDYVAVYST
ncbi:related to endo-1,3-beta-glucanase [Cephalotrichum gorgonifer]|uniref:Related to endo-1,3-beta-glucanase n=1 Tax=Cephalotrichum gorgonifer TaxID=2041049 RepID=A0AAE8N2Z3_9PEZI|nr:related to endo-1,3-beta-glucanase [Cephalotrichum gorgonifer]